MKAHCLTLSLLMTVYIHGLPLHTGRIKHIIHHHDDDHHGNHGHQGHNNHHHQSTVQHHHTGQPTTERNVKYDVHSNRHFRNGDVLFVQRISKHLQKSTQNKHRHTRKRFHGKSSTEGHINKNKNIHNQNERKVSQESTKTKHGIQQKIVTLPQKLQNSLLVDSVDHGFGIKKRGVSGTDLVIPRNHLTPHLPRRYIENLLKLNIWNSQNTIKVNPTSTELGRKWKQKTPSKVGMESKNVVASEFARKVSKRPTKLTMNKRPNGFNKEITPSSDLLQISIVSPESTPQPATTQAPHTANDPTKQTVRVNSSIEANLQKQYNVTKSDFIKLQGIHIMVSSMKQNLTSVLPTLHITAALSNTTEGKSNLSGTPVSNNPNGIKSKNASSKLDTLVGTAVMKSGHLYLVVYPFGQTKEPLVKYKDNIKIPLSNQGRKIVSKPTKSLQNAPKPHHDQHKPMASLLSVKQEQDLPSVTAKTGMHNQHFGHQSTASNSKEKTQSSNHHSSNEEQHMNTIPLESTSGNVMDHNGLVHHDLATALSHHSHISGQMKHSTLSHDGHSGHDMHGHSMHLSHGEPKTLVERFMSPWKQLNLSSVLPYLNYQSNKNNQSQEEDDSNLKLVSFIAEAKDPFVKVTRILSSLKNTTNNGNGDFASPNNPNPDATFNFELQVQGADISSTLNMINNSSNTGERTQDVFTAQPHRRGHHMHHVTGMPHFGDSNSDIVTTGYQDHQRDSFRNTMGSDSVYVPSDAVTSTSASTTKVDVIDPFTMFPTSYGDRKETDLYETIDSVIMQKLKAENITESNRSRDNILPNVTFENLGIAKETLTMSGISDEYNLNVKTRKDKGAIEPSTISMPRTTDTITSSTTQQPSIADRQVNSQNMNGNSHLNSGIPNYSVNSNSNSNAESVKGHADPLISLSDVLNDIRKIQLQNSVRFNTRNNNFDKMTVRDVDKVSNRNSPVILEGPLFGDFMRNSYQQSTSNSQSGLTTQATNGNYKTWNQEAVRHALDAMLVLSIDDILADHTTLRGTIVMAQNKDQNKDQSKDSSSSNSNN